MNDDRQQGSDDASASGGRSASEAAGAQDDRKPQRPSDQRRGSAAVRLALRAFVGLIALFVAFSFFRYLSSTAPTPSEKPEEALTKAVRVMQAEPAGTFRRWEAFGTVRPLDAAQVAAQVAGPIVERPDRIEAGVEVAEGDLLVRIDGAEYIRRRDAARRRVESLRAQLDGLEVERRSLTGFQDGDEYREGRVELAEEAAEIARRDFERARRAAERGSASPSEVDNLRGQLTQALRTAQQLREQLALLPSRVKALQSDILSAEADALVADLNYERTEVRAPRPGTVQEMSVDVGDRVAPGSPVARIVDLSRVEIPLKLAASASSSVRVGDRTVLRPTGSSQQVWEGEVARIAPEADATDRTVTVFVVVEQPPGTPPERMLRPGRFVQGQVISSNANRALVVPRTSIRDDDTVLVVNNENRIAPRRVSIDFRLEEEERFSHLVPGETEWAALSEAGPVPASDPTPPLGEGDLVVVSSIATLRPGTAVDPQIVATPSAERSVARRADDAPEANTR